MNSSLKLALVGGGQMGRALVAGMLAAKTLQSEGIRLVEPNPESCSWWADHHGDIAITDLATAVAEADVVVLALKPYIMATVAKQKPQFWDGKLVLSVAAGIGLESLIEWIGHGRVVRVMPNTPALVGAGASGYCCAAAVTDADRDTAQTLLGAVGIAVEVAESQMDAVTAVSGSGPAYVCLLVESLADGGVLAGLPRPLAMQLATQTVLGTAKMIAETGRHPGELKDSVASPGGTTIAALASLEHNGFRGTVIEAVAAAAKRSRELGKS
ncbi:Pyrroline-5-carboxylate reductase [Rubripirellula tenax]|uniref:Pyrroline-5-carboxylate reductase n=1 Tax=Rubripirellula tenax TaxID=2528015 RepID=A0A5C6F3S6_9BACT|nr:pyrroline-5-carboxylate reductase [Rubripirellula tenax]TWU54449.1 Pyrroline-5-carboxylate reductase [Rubripirellula tenax]